MPIKLKPKDWWEPHVGSSGDIEKHVSGGERASIPPKESAIEWSCHETFFEIGKRMSEENASIKTFRGVNADEYLQKAEAVYRDLQLTHDLEILMRFKKKVKCKVQILSFPGPSET